MKVAVIGGGVGGLTLGTALRSANVDVTVFEASRTSDGRKQAGRLVVAEAGLAALAQCTPAHLFSAITATGGATSRGLSVRDETMRLLSRTPVPADIGAQLLAVDRQTLRDLLIVGLGDQYRDGKTFVGYLPRPDGRYDVHFSDGVPFVADVVVGADGIGSAVRRLRAPQWQLEQVSTVTLCGRLPLGPLSLLPREVLSDDTVVVARDTATMVLAPFQFKDSATATFTRESHGRTLPQNYLQWTYTAPRASFEDADGLTQLKGRELHLLARARAKDFAPELRGIIEQTEPDSVSLRPAMHTAGIPDWKPEAVSLLGDALHPLPATAPIGVNITIQGAHLLATELLKAREGKPLLEAISDAEKELRAISAKAIEDARRVHEMTVGGADWLRRLRARFVPSMVKFDLWKRRRANVTSNV